MACCWCIRPSGIIGPTGRNITAGWSRRRSANEKYAEFEVTVTETQPPADGRRVPASFKITDELYRFANEPKDTPIEVLAEGKSLVTGKTYPVIWVVKHPKARIVCCTLGHDAQAHELAAYKTFLQNSLHWAAQK